MWEGGTIGVEIKFVNTNRTGIGEDDLLSKN